MLTNIPVNTYNTSFEIQDNAISNLLACAVESCDVCSKKGCDRCAEGYVLHESRCIPIKCMVR